MISMASFGMPVAGKDSKEDSKGVGKIEGVAISPSGCTTKPRHFDPLKTFVVVECPEDAWEVVAVHDVSPIPCLLSELVS